MKFQRQAAVAEATQVWHGKALANVESEADVLAEAVDGGEVVGKMYTNTILTVEEKRRCMVKGFFRFGCRICKK